MEWQWECYNESRQTTRASAKCQLEKSNGFPSPINYFEISSKEVPLQDTQTPKYLKPKYQMSEKYTAQNYYHIWHLLGKNFVFGV